RVSATGGPLRPASGTGSVPPAREGSHGWRFASPVAYPPVDSKRTALRPTRRSSALPSLTLSVKMPPLRSVVSAFAWFVSAHAHRLVRRSELPIQRSPHLAVRRVPAVRPHTA